MKWLGEKHGFSSDFDTFSSSEGRGKNSPFFLVLFLKEKGRILPELLRSRGKFRKKGRVFPYSEGVGENIEMGENARLPSQIACDLRRETAKRKIED